MRSFSLLSVFIAFWFSVCSCSPAPQPEDPRGTEIPEGGQTSPQDNNHNPTESMSIKITVGSKTFTADIEDSETGKAFMAKLPLTLDMSELNGNEKYCYGVELPRADKRYDSIAAGDLMLYSGNCIVLFYGSAGGYSYTRIGKLTNTTGLKEALGTGSVKVTFSGQDRQ
ncbi:MAG: hypothetical protein J6S66_04560 [Bacteroidales bacterium]|nr:hypothetical protein [Bacteroidales bacterium]